MLLGQLLGNTTRWRVEDLETVQQRQKNRYLTLQSLCLLSSLPIQFLFSPPPLFHTLPSNVVCSVTPHTHTRSMWSLNLKLLFSKQPSRPHSQFPFWVFASPSLHSCWAQHNFTHWKMGAAAVVEQEQITANRNKSKRSQNKV